MRTRGMALVAAIIGALVLNASAARAQAMAPEGPPSPALPGATPQAPAPAGPKTIHRKRDGFVLAGGLMLVPAYVVQVVAAAGISLSNTDSNCSSCYSKETKLLLIPIAGPWLANRAAPQQEQGASWPYLLWGGLEAAGVAMILIGLVGEDVPQDPQAWHVAFLPFVTPQAEGLSLSMRW